MTEFTAKTYHAIPLNDFKTYLDQNSVLSRRLLAAHNPYFTRFFSDPKDYELGCWNRTFGNFTDLGQGFSNLEHFVPNAFGAITLVFKESALTNLPDVNVTKISISQQNYNSQLHDIDVHNLSDCFEEKSGQFYPKSEFRGLEFSSSTETIELSNVAYIIVDPIIFNGEKLFDVVTQLVNKQKLGIKVIQRKLDSEGHKQFILNELVTLSNELHGSLLHRHQSISDFIPSSLESWYSQLGSVGNSILASWLTYTYNGTLLHLK